MKMRAVLLVAVVALIASACSGNVFELTVGDCFDDPDSFEEVSDVEMVDCEEPHDNEVYETFELADGDYPGLASIEESAAAGCIDAFEPYVGTDILDSSLDASYLYPTSDSWGGGDREIVCMLYDLSGNKLTGSARNSGL